MGNVELTGMLKNYLSGIEQYMHNSGDKKVSHFLFPGGYNNGCGSHPDMAQHQLIAEQLAGYLKRLEDW
jgi:hypothetical protein